MTWLTTAFVRVTGFQHLVPVTSRSALNTLNLTSVHRLKNMVFCVEGTRKHIITFKDENDADRWVDHLVCTKYWSIGNEKLAVEHEVEHESGFWYGDDWYTQHES